MNECIKELHVLRRKFTDGHGGKEGSEGIRKNFLREIHETKECKGIMCAGGGSRKKEVHSGKSEILKRDRCG